MHERIQFNNNLRVSASISPINEDLRLAIEDTLMKLFSNNEDMSDYISHNFQLFSLLAKLMIT